MTDSSKWCLPAGLVVLPGVLTMGEQRRILADAFLAWPEPPNHTNHSAHLGPLPGLWTAAQAVRPSTIGSVIDRLQSYGFSPACTAYHSYELSPVLEPGPDCRSPIQWCALYEHAPSVFSEDRGCFWTL